MKMLTMCEETNTLVLLKFEYGSKYATFDYINNSYQTAGFMKKEAINKDNVTFTDEFVPYALQEPFKRDVASITELGLHHCCDILKTDGYGINKGVTYWGFPFTY